MISGSAGVPKAGPGVLSGARLEPSRSSAAKEKSSRREHSPRIRAAPGVFLRRKKRPPTRNACVERAAKSAHAGADDATGDSVLPAASTLARPLALAIGVQARRLSAGRTTVTCDKRPGHKGRPNGCILLRRGAVLLRPCSNRRQTAGQPCYHGCDEPKRAQRYRAPAVVR